MMITGVAYLLDSHFDVEPLGRFIERLSTFARVIRANLIRCRARLVNPSGEGCLARFDGPARTVACARAIVGDTKALGLDVRAGIHAGELVVRGDDSPASP